MQQNGYANDSAAASMVAEAGGRRGRREGLMAVGRGGEE